MTLKRITDDEIVQAIFSLKDTKDRGLRSNFKQLDNAVGGIWRDGIVIQGPPDAGKTSLCKNLQVAFCIGHNAVIDLDLENPKTENLINLMAIFLASFHGKGAPTRGQLTDNPEILAEGVNVELRVKHLLPYYYRAEVDEEERKKKPEQMLYGWVAGVARELPRGKQVALFLDSLQYLADSSPLSKDPLQNVEKWISTLVRVRARAESELGLNLPIFLIPHRLKSTHNVDEMMQLKGSSAIPHWARTQLKLERTGPNDIKVKVLRAQYGTGKGNEIFFHFDQARLLMEEYQSERRDW